MTALTVRIRRPDGVRHLALADHLAVGVQGRGAAGARLGLVRGNTASSLSAGIGSVETRSQVSTPRKEKVWCRTTARLGADKAPLTRAIWLLLPLADGSFGLPAAFALLR